MAKIEHVSHVKSKLPREIEEGEFYGLTPTADNSDEADSSPVKLNLAKRPTAENIIYGEIAVNYKKGHETITIKNDEDEIVGFVNENDFNNAQEIVASALANEKTEREQQINIVEQKVSTVEQSSGEVENDLSELDLAVSAALNDLNSRIGEQSDEFEESIQNLQQNLETLENNLEEYHDDTELVISSSLNDLNNRINTNSENISILNNKIGNIDGETIERIEEFGQDLENIEERLDGIEERLDGVDTSIEGIGDRLDGVDTSIEGIDDRLDGIDTSIEGIGDRLDGVDDRLDGNDERFDEIEEVVSSSLNDLNTRIIDLSEMSDDISFISNEMNEMYQEFTDFKTETEDKIEDILDTIGDGDTHDSPNDLLNRVAELERLINTVSYCYDYFDFGLPSGALWSTRNIGATSATDNGLYFAWGETTGYKEEEIGHPKSFSWSDYELCTYSNNHPTLTKYNSTDQKTICEALDDAATVNMIGKWHLPTMQQLKEILQNTKNGWISDSGVFTVFSWSNDGEGGLDGNPTNTSVSDITAFNGKAGFLFFKSDVSDIPTAINKNNYIFIPAAGNVENGQIYRNNDTGYVWTSTLYVDVNEPDPDNDYYNAWTLMFTSSSAALNHSAVINNSAPRFNGHSVRGVIG